MSCSCNPVIGDGPSFPCDCNSGGGGLLGPPIQQSQQQATICARANAPHGFKYRLIAGECVLVHASSGLPVIPFAGNTILPVASPVDTAKAWVIANPLLSLAIGGAAYYFLTKK